MPQFDRQLFYPADSAGQGVASHAMVLFMRLGITGCGATDMTGHLDVGPFADVTQPPHPTTVTSGRALNMARLVNCRFWYFTSISEACLER